MSTGTWQPTQAGSSTLSQEALARFISIGKQEPMANLSDQLSDQEKSLGHIMQLSQADWEGYASAMANEEIKALVRFFTLAEMQIDGWHGGKQSPVIWLCKVLKKTGGFPDKELIRWIKANTDNRFLPFGSIL